jgi:hypothetical protein
MGDSLSTLRTRFLDEIDDPGQTASTATNARLTRVINEGLRHAAYVIQRRDPKFPQDDWPVNSSKDVERYPLPEDFAEDYRLARVDLTSKPSVSRISVNEWNHYRYYSRDALLAGPVAGVNDVSVSTGERYYIERPWIGLLPVPGDATRKYVLSYRPTLRDLADDSDETPIPAGAGTDVAMIYGAIVWLSRKGADVSALAARLQAAESRLEANFGASAGSSPAMQEAQLYGVD